MKFVRFAGWSISILSIVYIAYKVINLRVDFLLLLRPSTASFLLLGIILHVVSMFILAQAYYLILNHFQKTEGAKAGYFHLYAKSNLAKYLPGNVMHLVSRNLSAREVGASQKEVAITSIAELVLVLIAATSLVIFIRPEQVQKIFAWLHPLRLIVAAIVFVIVFALVFARFRSSPWLKTISVNRRLVYRIGLVLSLYVAMFLLQALIPVVIAFSLPAAALDLFVVANIVNGFLVSWIAGFVTIGAPGGIGVREVIFCSLVPGIATESLLFISVSQRLVNIVGDILFFLMILAFASPAKIKGPDQLPE